jgi:hypothetical protein
MAHQNEIEETQAPTTQGTGRFKKGNQAAAKLSKKAVAAMIAARLEKEKDSLTPAQFTSLVNRYGSLTKKRRRRSRRMPENEKVRGRSDADRLAGAAAETHRTVLQIEAERLEAGRKKWHEEQEAEQKDRKPTPTESVETVLPVLPSRTGWLLKADV